MISSDALKLFLAVERHETLSAAALSLGATEQAIKQQVATLHEKTGGRIFRETNAGLTVTEAGQRLLRRAEKIESEAALLERLFSGQEEPISGEVRITTVDPFGSRIVIPIMRKLTEQHPALEVELISDSRSFSLSRGEADIAIRLSSFEQHDVVVTQVADMAHGLYASRDYLARHGRPDFSDGCAGHSVIGFQQDMMLVPEAKRLAKIAPNATTTLRSNSRDVHVHGALTGYGFAFLPCYLALESDELVELETPEGRIVRSLWLGVHRNGSGIPRIAMAVDHLTRELKANRHRLVPPPSLTE